MSSDARAHMIERFSADAHALRRRASQQTETPAPFPAGEASHAPAGAIAALMAEACENIVMAVRELPQPVDVASGIIDLASLIPRFETSARLAKSPQVRAVYAGAIIRIREMHRTTFTQ